MSTDIIMDLHSDFATACARELQSAGYTVPNGPADEVIRSYANVQHRRVPRRQREVHKACYAVPTHLVDGERAFLAAVAAGMDLRPYQSTRLEKADFDDGMLNDFGIQHFHLGTVRHSTKPSFMARTEPVLFALVQDDYFYSLGCYNHGNWTQTSLLDLIHATWPKAIASYSLNSEESDRTDPTTIILGLRRSYTDVEIGKLRKAGVNAITQRPDGTIHVGPGGGVTTNRKSARVAMEVATIQRWCRQVEHELNAKLAAMIASGDLVAPITLRLEQRGNETFAIIDDDRGEFDLGRSLFVPSL